MFKLSKSVALFIKDDSKLFFKNVIHTSSKIVFEHNMKNDSYRSIDGKCVVADNSKYVFKIKGVGNIPCIISDMYVLDSSIIIEYDEFKRKKNSSYVFANFKNAVFSLKKFDKIWNDSFINDICVLKEELYENDNFKLLDEDKKFIIPILHCKLISKKNFSNNRWSLEFAEV